ncbi:MAG TPA: energy transducer TonB [Chitinophagaceae bacterium]|jgi:TonB family protein
MKQLLILILLSVSISSLHAQDVKEKTVVIDKPNKIKEVFFVLRTDETIRQGKYSKYQRDNLLISGFYTQGKPDSTWMGYIGNKCITVKHFNRGIPTGTWEQNDQNGNPEIKYNFATDELTDSRDKEKLDSTEKTCYRKDGAGSLEPFAVDRMPIRLQSKTEYLLFLQFNLQYPQEAIDKKEQGTSLIAISLDENGTAVDYSLYSSKSQSLGIEALRTVRLFNPQYLPAIQNGHKVPAIVLQPVTVRLEF